MKNTDQATHNHKRAGAVVVLRSTTELAEVRTLPSGDHFWVKIADLTEVGSVADAPKPRVRARTAATAGKAGPL